MGITMPVLWYLGQIWWKVPGSWKQKKRILACMVSPVRDYVERNPNGGYNAIVIHFGKPEQVAESYLVGMEVDELAKHLRIRRKFVTILIASALAIVLLWACVVLTALYKYGEAMPGYIERIVEEVEQIPKGED